MKRLFFGPRGAWNNRFETIEDHWILGSNENLQRMRMKLVPNPKFDDHSDASAQRDNVKRASESVDNLLQHQIAVAAVNHIGKFKCHCRHSLQLSSPATAY